MPWKMRMVMEYQMYTRWQKEPILMMSLVLQALILLQIGLLMPLLEMIQLQIPFILIYQRPSLPYMLLVQMQIVTILYQSKMEFMMVELRLQIGVYCLSGIWMVGMSFSN